ncbi:hypothetical protein QGN23_00985 [Chryseobacterium gotjawalense]|uniref:Cell wall anchor protein n=1 Tax=Chryseobacterium gotjawalense TaxID=3042315 RepID=A0ABY8RF43_9FLAO|nr:hypothetical protein [Chryseobacterium sp. wdc7]WHF51867.1 hypothetical protein QGN23_00985 [Chryseobacterium sp. wdc7]
MKKFLFFVYLFFSFIGFGQIFKFTFAGSSTCPTPDNTPIIQNLHTTVTPLLRQNVNCSATASSFNSNAWPTGATQNENNYIEVTVSASAGYQLSISSFSFDMQRSASGPTYGKIAIDKGSGLFSQSFDIAPSESSQNINWDFDDFTVSSGLTVRFRIYGWQASAGTGTLRLNHVTLSGAVTLQNGVGTGNSPFTASGGNVGLDKIPTQKLDINGNIRTSGKLLVGDIGDGAVNILSDYSLAVNGGALFTSATVKLNSNWPDYVFKNNYQLISLEEVEKHIIEKGHLPDIPSAKEVKISGINLGEMNVKLLTKIEELTLYSIEQNKKIKKQSEQIEKLEKSLQNIQKDQK